MKRNEIKALVMAEPKRMLQSACALLMAAVLGISSWNAVQIQNEIVVPELTSCIHSEDGDVLIDIDEDEVPLASNSKTTQKTSTKTTKKTVKLAAASKSTYTKKLKTTTKVTNKTQNTAKATTKTKTTVVTSATETYKKSSKYKTVATTVKTTVQTTVTQKATTSTVKLASIAPKADQRVRNAYDKLGFKVIINSGVSYSGYFNARSQSITLRKKDASIYHELGHFVAFVAGNVDKSAAFQKIYKAEKGKYTGTNKKYVTQDSSEYFAESFKDYTLSPAALKKARPQTYAYIRNALNTITTARVSKIKTVYASIWK